MSTDATTTDGRTTDTPQTEEAAGSAAERLGGPSEREQRLERASEQETGARRQADTAEAETDDTRSGTSTEERATLIPPDRAESYNSRWTQLKSDFVDEPSRAVRGANELVGEVLDELEELFRRQRAELEQGLDSEQTTTEDLRQALGRYRSFFDRLLSKRSQLRRAGRLSGWMSPCPARCRPCSGSDRQLYRTGRLSGRWTSMLDHGLELLEDSGSQCRRREGKKRNSIKSSKLVGLLAKVA